MYNWFHNPGQSSAEIARLRELHAAMDRAVLDAYAWRDVRPGVRFRPRLARHRRRSARRANGRSPDDIRDRIDSADYFFSDAAAACRFQSHIKQSGRGKLPWRCRWPDEIRDDILARLLALNAHRAELERLTGLPGTGNGVASAAPADTNSDDSTPAAAPKAKRAKKASKRASKKSAPRPMFDE